MEHTELSYSWPIWCNRHYRISYLHFP